MRMNTMGVILYGFEVTVVSDINMRYVIKKVVLARNEYDAVLEMARYLSSDFNFHFDDYEVVKVVNVD